MTARLQLAGRRFGKWKVLRFYDTERYKCQGKEHSRRRWLCRCLCGTERKIVGYTLIHGLSQMCRLCAAKEHSEKVVDLTLQGKKLGSVKVLSFLGCRKKKSRWKVLCNCGHIWIASGEWLKRSAHPQCRICAYKKTGIANRILCPVGKRFGKRTVLRFAGIIDKVSKFLVRCDCGKESIIEARGIKRNKSCGSCSSFQRMKNRGCRDFSTIRNFGRDGELFKAFVRNRSGSDKNIEERFKQWLQIRELEKKLSLKLSN